MPLKSLILFLLLGIFFYPPLHSQTFPVQITLQQLPPYTPFLSDFTTPGPDRLRISLLLLDTREPRLQVKLKLSIQGSGLAIKSNPSFVSQPIILSPNIPTILTNNDLSGLFDPTQLEFSGITSDNFLKSGKLPEGTYTICAEVYHFIRDETPLSDKACSVAFLQELDPPDIISPAAEPTPIFPQQFLVSWIPRHIGLFPVEYTVDIIEKIPGLSDQELFYVGRPLIHYQGPYLNYRIGPEDPPLEIGKSYLIRVRIKDPSGRYTFKNDGNAPPYSFTYGKECIAPTITETKLQGNAIHISWQAQAPLTEFDLRYRYKEEPWQTIKLKSNQYSLPIKVIGGKYDFQVSSRCYNQIDLNSEVVSYKLNRKNLPPDFYVCGVELELEERASASLEELNANDTIIANGMRIILSSAQKNSDGTYSGAGVIGFSLFGKVGIQCNFEGISLNENYEMTGGSINVTGAGAKIMKDQHLALLDGLIESLKTASDILKISTASASFEYLNRFGAFVSNDLQDKIDQLLTTINNTDNPDAKDKALEELKLVMQGMLEEIDELLDADFQLKFVKNDNQVYGFDGLADQPSDPAMKSAYEEITIAKSPYHTPYKSIEIGKGDIVNATAPNVPDNILEKIYFKTNLDDTSALPASRTGNTFSITLPAIHEKGEYFVLAAYPDILHADTDSAKVISRVAGMLKVIVFERKIKNVVIVPLNGANPPNPLTGTSAIQNEINKIFNQAVLSWSVSVAPNYDAPGYDGTIDSIHSGFLANYTAEMRNIISSYTKENKDDTTQYYLFVTNAHPGSGLKGFMPRGRNYGFIISSDAKTIAHELAHGYGTLEHTWEVYKKSSAATTDYLMDYRDAGIDLMKREWDMLQNPPGMVPWMQGDDEGQRILQQSFYHDRYVYFQYTGQNDCFASITPSGQKINLPQNALASYYPADGGAWPKGSLTGFVIENKVYLGWWNPANSQFYGYAPANNKGEAIKPYYTGVSGSCITYAGYGNDLNCTQTILSDSASYLVLPYVLGDSSKIISTLSLTTMSEYETGKGVKGPCGCYTGDCAEALEKYKNHKYLKEDSPLRRAICKNPCLLNNPFLEYDHFPEDKSEWMEDFNQAFGTLLHIGMAPAAVGIAIPMTADVASSVFINSIRELVRLKGKDFIIGFTFDLLVQRAINAIFNSNEPFTPDYAQALTSAVESTISLKSALGEVAVSAALECFVSGNFDDGKIKEDFDVQACAKGALWATLIQGGIKGAGYGIRQIPKDKFIDGLIDLIASKDPSLLRAGPVDDSYLWMIYKLSHPIPLKADDIQHLFKTSTLDATTDTWIDAINDPAIQKTLLEEGFYLKFRKLEGVSNEERKEMLRELLARAKVDGDGGKKAVGEWLSNKFSKYLNKDYLLFFNELIGHGLNPELLGSTILLKNNLGEVVASIFENKLTVVKWSSEFKLRGQGYDKSITSEGYWIFKKGDDILVDLGFKKGRILEADEVNNYLKATGAQLEGAPYKVGTLVEEIELMPGTIIHVAEYLNNGLPNPGGYGSKDLINTLIELREKWAVLKNWKDETIDKIIFREYEIVTPVKTRSGIIGPQLETSTSSSSFNIIYNGGGHQYGFVDNFRSWKNFATNNILKDIELK